MLSLFGSGIGRGIAIGQAYVLKNRDIEPPHIQIERHNVTKEVTRFSAAVASVESRYQSLLDGLPKDAPKESAAFITAHMLMLRDPLLIDESLEIIRKDLVNAEHALQRQADNLIKVFENMQDPYLREKKSDVKHITDRLMRHLLGVVTHSLDEFNDEDLRGKIIVGKDLTPAETMFVRDRKIVAFVTDLGSQISHTAIVARSLKLPAVVGLHSGTRYISDNDLLIVDGLRGTILVNPTKGILKEYKGKVKRLRERERQLTSLISKVSKTSDGKRVNLLANIETKKELRDVKRVNAAGVGLYRTEYLFMNRQQAPTEAEQFRAYKKIVSGVEKPVTIRTLDIGGDKRLAFNYPNKVSSESPLGLRAVRLCLNHVELFIPQVRAILRASAFGKVSILKMELKQQNIAFDSRIKIGGMIEVPAAAIMADVFARKLDFLSIGTNDLIQYTLAIDRIDDAVNYLYDPIHPAVLQLIKNVIQAGEKANIPVSLCGEMAGNERYTRLLLGLGLKNFSMDATYILDIKEKILTADTSKLRYLVRKILNADHTNEARDLLRKLNDL